ncbi:MAG: FAD-dependent oxidoreductase [Betaproteobacteria bacterium]|nr:FAD-dependent oxidoreductase [Betaproteobacteria bacterium]
MSPGSGTTTPRVAVIGAGYAGVAAAVRLTLANIRVCVFESAHTPGGRARSIQYHEHILDNGQHMLVGAYANLLALLDVIGMGEAGLLRMPMQMRMHPDFRLTTPRLPAPLNLAWGLIMAEGLSWRDRMAATRLSNMVRKPCLPPKLRSGTVAELLAATGQTEKLVRALWLPLCIAALNTPIETASADVFANVLRDALFKRREHSDFLLPTVGLTELFPGPALQWLSARGGAVHLGTRVRAVSGEGRGFTILTDKAKAMGDSFDAVVCAVGPHQLDELGGLAATALPASRPLRFEPICTVYLAYSSPVPLPAIMVGSERGVAQWFFDRSQLGGPGGLIAAVISASGPHERMAQSKIASQAHAELQQITGPLETPLWSKVITERFATFACTPDAPRPGTRTNLPGFYLAGDYTAGPYPATLEGAVRSGEAAAAQLIADLAH